MDVQEIRKQSKERVESLNYRFNPNLPVLDPVEITRGHDEVAGRILALYACVSCAYGFAKQDALHWLERQGLMRHLSDLEIQYLNGKEEAKRAAIQWQVEALWALTWAAGYHSELDFSDSCPDTFVGIFPDIKTNASSNAFAEKCKLRPNDEIAEFVDLAYCLHWSVRDEALTASQQEAGGKVPGHVIEERRRGLEWLIGDEDWDHVSLDT